MLPLEQKFTNIWQIFDSLFLIWQNAEHTLGICDIIGLIFTAVNGQILKKLSNHLVTLITRNCVYHTASSGPTLRPTL